MLSIIEIDKLDVFDELRKKWNQILARSKDNHIFLTWEYLSTFWKHFGKKINMKILCVEDEKEIVAIAPLRQFHYGISSRLGYEVIEPLGYRGNMPDGGDYTGLLLGENENECFRLFLNYLAEQKDWDFIYLYDVPGTSIIPSLLTRMSRSPLKIEIKEGAVCPYVTFPSSVDIFLEKLNGKFRKNLRRSMKNLERDYGKVEIKKHNDFCSLNDAMEIFFRLHQMRWRSKHKQGVFSTQAIRDFYIDVAKSFFAKRWLALYFLTVKDEPIAAHFCFEYQRKMYFALSGYDLNFSKYSVSSLLTLKIIEKCIEKNLTEFDFMKGDEPYKFKWTNKYRRNVNIKFVNNKLTSRLYYLGIRAIKQTRIDRTLEKFRLSAR